MTWIHDSVCFGTYPWEVAIESEIHETRGLYDIGKRTVPTQRVHNLNWLLRQQIVLEEHCK